MALRGVYKITGIVDNPVVNKYVGVIFILNTWHNTSTYSKLKRVLFTLTLPLIISHYSDSLANATCLSLLKLIVKNHLSLASNIPEEPEFFSVWIHPTLTNQPTASLILPRPRLFRFFLHADFGAKMVLVVKQRSSRNAVWIFYDLFYEGPDIKPCLHGPGPRRTWPR